MRCGYSSLQVLDWSLQISRLRFRLSTAPSHDLHASTSFARRYTQPLAAHRACAVSGAGRDRDRERERERVHRRDRRRCLRCSSAPRSSFRHNLSSGVCPTRLHRTPRPPPPRTPILTRQIRYRHGSMSTTRQRPSWSLRRHCPIPDITKSLRNTSPGGSWTPIGMQNPAYCLPR